MSSARAERLRIIVRGRVQGVFFRASAARIARTAGLKGFARNLADGSVEIVAEGPRPSLENLLRWSRRGPPGARVDEIVSEWANATGEFADFEIR
jgi:acylphosphatase